MQIEVHDVHAEIAGAGFADEGVHVGAVHVEERAFGVEDVGNFVDLGLEDADGRRIGEHERGGVLGDLALEGFDVHHAAFVGLEVFDLVAADGGGGGIGSVSGVGNEDLVARIAVGLVISADEKDSGELTMGSGGRLEGDGVHAGDFEQTLLQIAHDVEHTLG